MTPEKQGTAIATHLNWARHTQETYGCYPDSTEGWLHPKYGFYQFLPDYLGNSNAMREVESNLPAHLRDEYLNRLNEIVQRTHRMATITWLMVNASPAQRAEAYLRANNLWEESNAKN